MKQKQFLATNLQFNKDGTVSLIKEGQKRKNRFRNTKIEKDGILFDSIHECSFYSHAKMLGVRFELKKKVILQEKFKSEGSAVRAITLTPDFWILGPNHTPEAPEYIAIVDTKGKETESSRIKFKLLQEWLVKSGLHIPVFKPKSHSENIQVLMELQKLYSIISVKVPNK